MFRQFMYFLPGLSVFAVSAFILYGYELGIAIITTAAGIAFLVGLILISAVVHGPYEHYKAKFVDDYDQDGNRIY